MAIDVNTRLRPEAIEHLAESFARLRDAHTQRFNPPLGVTNAALYGAEVRLLREVSSTLMFLLDEMVRSSPS